MGKDYQAVVNGMIRDYVDLMPDRSYDMVGRNIVFPSEDQSLGVMRVDFDDRKIYSEDIQGREPKSWKRELVAENFCNYAIKNLADYSCEPLISMPLAEIEPVNNLEYDFWFQRAETLDSLEAQIFFEDLFDVKDIEQEFSVRVLE